MKLELFNNTRIIPDPIAVGRTHVGMQISYLSFVTLLRVDKSACEMVGGVVELVVDIGDASVTRETELVAVIYEIGVR